MSTYETAQVILLLVGAVFAAFGWQQVREIKKLRRWEAEQDALDSEGARLPAE